MCGGRCLIGGSVNILYCDCENWECRYWCEWKTVDEAAGLELGEIRYSKITRTLSMICACT